jgi:molybdopterin converting factor subunit 1
MAPVSTKLRVHVLFFGRIRELTGMTEDDIEVPAGATLYDLFGLYIARYPVLAELRSSLVVSRNEEFSAWDAPLSLGDDVAFLPPVSGG